MRVKDAIVDYFERQGKARPNVDKDYPDVRIHAYLIRRTRRFTRFKWRSIAFTWLS